ncbi:hypothetical protein ACOT81_39590 [Streptomyces sp. WI04-05B]|uniref:hypothetical protein n=1 Tax=Streptomyces TaxID=1883 RepID=UPI000314D87A|nr:MULTISPECIES: hypothetical protein [Streptomyces]MDX2548238.1 hypothetical protein [Streptomyces sp. WI04-05B]MDX2590275.1 hypothetical protein [Streptomyces sp. WI04-05A]MDX3500261.1 hypothetical protein [Streptomyces turgidiscabies]
MDAGARVRLGRQREEEPLGRVRGRGPGAAWMAWTAAQECPNRSSPVAVTAASVSNASIRMNRSPRDGPVRRFGEGLVAVQQQPIARRLRL